MDLSTWLADLFGLADGEQPEVGSPLAYSCVRCEASYSTALESCRQCGGDVLHDDA